MLAARLVAVVSLAVVVSVLGSRILPVALSRTVPSFLRHAALSVTRGDVAVEPSRPAPASHNRIFCKLGRR